MNAVSMVVAVVGMVVGLCGLILSIINSKATRELDKKSSERAEQAEKRYAEAAQTQRQDDAHKKITDLVEQLTAEDFKCNCGNLANQDARESVTSVYRRVNAAYQVLQVDDYNREYAEQEVGNRLTAVWDEIERHKSPQGAGDRPSAEVSSAADAPARPKNDTTKYSWAGGPERLKKWAAIQRGCAYLAKDPSLADAVTARRAAGQNASEHSVLLELLTTVVDRIVEADPTLRARTRPFNSRELLVPEGDWDAAEKAQVDEHGAVELDGNNYAIGWWLGLGNVAGVGRAVHRPFIDDYLIAQRGLPLKVASGSAEAAVAS